MSTSRGQAGLDANRRWRAAHPIKSRPMSEKQKQLKKERYDEIAAAINPCYLKEARAMLAGTKKRYNPCTKLAGDD